MKQKSRRRRKSRRAVRRIGCGLIVCVVGLLVAGLLLPRWMLGVRLKRLREATPPEWIRQELLTNPNARNGKPLEELSGIVIHYVGNPGTTAMNNRNYFEKEETQVCSHFVVGLDGEIVQCVPLGEQSAASNHRNRDTISIEVCHPDESGQFSAVTYASLVRLTAWLCRTGHLPADAVIRHYDVTGKLCPLYYVQNEDAWEQFLRDVKAEI